MHEELIESLRKEGAFAFFQRPGQLVISSAFPQVPTANSFWIALIRGSWYVSTWLPAVYRLPQAQAIRDVCLDILRSSETAIYRVDRHLVEKYGLEELPSDQADTLFNQHFGSGAT